MASAADRFASAQGTEPLEGQWVGFGLIPRFDDSPTAEWVSELSNVPDIEVALVDFNVPRVRIPEAWDEIADLPFDIDSGAIVESVGSGIVVLQPDSTLVIDPDGSFTTGEAPPVAIPIDCCGDVRGISTDTSLVVGSWILDPETLTWRQTDPRPIRGFVLGSAFINGELFVVTAADRTDEAISLSAALDVATG